MPKMMTFLWKKFKRILEEMEDEKFLEE